MRLATETTPLSRTSALYHRPACPPNPTRRAAAGANHPRCSRTRYYSIFTLLMLVVFESTVVHQRQRNLAELRALQTPKQHIQVQARVLGECRLKGGMPIMAMQRAGGRPGSTPQG